VVVVSTVTSATGVRTVADADLYPLALLTGYTLMPTNSGKGVMAVCQRHDGAVSALVVNDLSEPPSLGDLAFMAGEHEAEHQGGPAMPDTDADEGQDDHGPSPDNAPHLWVGRDGRPPVGDDTDRCDACGAQRSTVTRPNPSGGEQA